MWFRHDGSACRCWVTVAKNSAVLPGTRQDARSKTRHLAKSQSARLSRRPIFGLGQRYEEEHMKTPPLSAEARFDLST